jgi:hypothetical protein
VPRRLEIPLLAPATVDQEPPGKRIHRPALFPGADYPVHDTATAIRGQVVRNGKPMPWARVEAKRGNVFVGRAHGDDRGEFLLLLDSRAATPGGTSLTVTVRVSVFGRDPELPAPSALVVSTDPHWSLPVERLPLTANATDPVSRGDTLPNLYTKVAFRDLTIRLGEVHSELNPFVIL